MAVFTITSNEVLFPIESNSRGTDMLNTFATLTHASSQTFPEIALQTSVKLSNYASYSGITNGLIPYVQSLTKTVHNTLLIVTYLPPLAPTNVQRGSKLYVVVPAEQIDALLYFPNRALANNSPTFNSTTITGTLPFYVVDPQMRAVDIASAVTTLLSAPFQTASSQVWIQTTLTNNSSIFLTLAGNNNAALNNGLLQNVQSVSAAHGLIQINFIPFNPTTSPTQLTLYVTPEQVSQITYVLYPFSKAP